MRGDRAKAVALRSTVATGSLLWATVAVAGTIGLFDDTPPEQLALEQQNYDDAFFTLSDPNQTDPTAAERDSAVPSPSATANPAPALIIQLPGETPRGTVAERSDTPVAAAPPATLDPPTREEEPETARRPSPDDGRYTSNPLGHPNHPYETWNVGNMHIANTNTDLRNDPGWTPISGVTRPGWNIQSSDDLNGTRYASKSGEGSRTVWNIEPGQLLGPLEVREVHSDGTVTVKDTRTGNIVHVTETGGELLGAEPISEANAASPSSPAQSAPTGQDGTTAGGENLASLNVEPTNDPSVPNALPAEFQGTWDNGTTFQGVRDGDTVTGTYQDPEGYSGVFEGTVSDNGEVAVTFQDTAGPDESAFETGETSGTINVDDTGFVTVTEKPSASSDDNSSGEVVTLAPEAPATDTTDSLEEPATDLGDPKGEEAPVAPPEDDSTIPDETVTPPDDSSTIPDETVTPPDDSSTIPDETVTPPGDSSPQEPATEPVGTEPPDSPATEISPDPSGPDASDSGSTDPAPSPDTGSDSTANGSPDTSGTPDADSDPPQGGSTDGGSASSSSADTGAGDTSAAGDSDTSDGTDAGSDPPDSGSSDTSSDSSTDAGSESSDGSADSASDTSGGADAGAGPEDSSSQDAGADNSGGTDAESEQSDAGTTDTGSEPSDASGTTSDDGSGSSADGGTTSP